MKTKLVVGLGNPGDKYFYNKHNIGFLFLDYLLNHKNYNFEKDKSNKTLELLKSVNINLKLFLLKPLTFMNNSGIAINNIKKFYKIDNQDIIVIHDDFNFDFGKIKITENGSAGGHNGIKSIISYIGQNFVRVKVGVGQPEKNVDISNFVLSDFNKQEKLKLSEYFDYINQPFELLLNNETQKAMSLYSKKNIFID